MGQILVATSSWTDKTLIESAKFYPPSAKTPRIDCDITRARLDCLGHRSKPLRDDFTSVALMLAVLISIKRGGARRP